MTGHCAPASGSAGRRWSAEQEEGGGRGHSRGKSGDELRYVESRVWDPICRKPQAKTGAEHQKNTLRSGIEQTTMSVLRVGVCGPYTQAGSAKSSLAGGGRGEHLGGGTFVVSVGSRGRSPPWFPIGSLRQKKIVLLHTWLLSVLLRGWRWQRVIFIVVAHLTTCPSSVRAVSFLVVGGQSSRTEDPPRRRNAHSHDRARFFVLVALVKPRREFFACVNIRHRSVCIQMD